MARIFGILVLIVMLALFPPAVLAVISNDAVPGDITYPVKRVLEVGILTIVSVNPNTKALFTLKRSERRFTEVTHLFEEGDRSQNLSGSLGDLVKHTREAAKDISKLQDPEEKKQKVFQLKQSIEKYKKELEAEENKIDEETNYSTPSSQAGPTQTPVPSQAVYQTPSAAIPSTAPVPTTGIRTTPSPTRALNPTLQPTRTLIPTPTPTPSENPPDCTDPNLSEAYRRAAHCLEEIVINLPAGDIPAPPVPTSIPTPTSAVIHTSGDAEPEPTQGVVEVSPSSSPVITTVPFVMPTTTEPTPTAVPSPTPLPPNCYRVLTAPSYGCPGAGTMCNNDGNLICTPD